MPAVLALVLLGAVGLQVVDGALFTRNLADRGRVATPMSLGSIAAEEDRYRFEAALWEAAPGAWIVLDDGTHPSGASAGEPPAERHDPLMLRHLAGAAGVVAAPLPAFTLPDTVDVAAIGMDEEVVRIAVGDPPVTTVLVRRDDVGRLVVDERFVDAALPPGSLERPIHPLARWLVPVPDPSGVGRMLLGDVAVESTLLLLLVLLGGLVVPRDTVRGALRGPVALLAGVTLQVVAGLLLLPGVGTLLAAAGLGLAGAAVLHRWGIGTGWRAQDRATLAGMAAGVLLASLLVRSLGLVVVSPDSIEYLTQGRALGLGGPVLADLELKRGLALQALHAPAFALGIEGLHAIGVLLLGALAAVLVLVPRALVPGDVASVEVRWATGVGVLAATLLVSSDWIRFLAVYANSHLLVGAMLLLVVLAWVLEDPDARHAPMALVVVGALGTVVLARAEAALLVGLVLSATLGASVPRWRWAWPAAGALLAAWNGLIAAGAAAAGRPQSVVVVALGAAGLVLLLIGPLVVRAAPVVRRAISSAVLVGLWAVTLGLLIASVTGRIGIRFFSAQLENVLRGTGRWGITGAVLLLVVGAAALLTRTDDRERPAWHLVVGAVPVTLLAMLANGTQRLETSDAGRLLEVFLSGGGRVSWADSGNRMLSHFVPLALLTLVVAAVRSDHFDGARRPLAASLPRVLGIAVPMLLLVGLWAPAHAGPPGPSAVVSSIDAPVSPGTVELSDRVRRAQRLTLAPDTALPADATSGAVCVTVVLASADGDGDGVTAGRVLVNIAAMEEGEDLREGSLDVSGAALGPSTERRVCMTLDPAEPLPTSLEVTVMGDGGTPGSSPLLRTVEPDTHGPATSADERPFVTALTLEAVAASTDPRGATTRAVSVGLRGALRWGPALGLLALTVAVLAAGRRGTRRDRTG